MLACRYYDLVVACETVLMLVIAVYCYDLVGYLVVVAVSHGVDMCKTSMVAV